MCLMARNPRFGIGRPLIPFEVEVLEEWINERKRTLDLEPRRGLKSDSVEVGWRCPNCGGAHGPQISTCPEEPRGGSLRERLSR